MRTVWDGRVVPLIATIARGYTQGGLAALSSMFRQRSQEWRFDYEILKWSGESLIALASVSVGSDRTRDPALSVPEIRPETSTRSANATLEQLRAVAAERGVLDLFDHAVDLGRQLGLKLDFRTKHVTLTPIRGRGWLPVLPAQSSPELGLILDCASTIVPHLATLDLTEHGRGQFSYARFSVRDKDTLTKVVEAASAAVDPRPGVESLDDLS